MDLRIAPASIIPASIVPVWALLTTPATLCLAALAIGGWLAPGTAALAIGLAATIALLPALLWRHGLATLHNIPTQATPRLMWPGLRALATRIAQRERQHSLQAADHQALRQRDATLLDLLPEPLLLLGPDRALLRANPAARTRFGADLVALLRHPALAAALAEAHASRAIATVDIRLIVPIPRTLRASVIPLPHPLTLGTLTIADGALILCADHAAEQAMARLHADFVANASHELRTPLTALLGFIETLRGSAADDPPAQTRFLAIMAEQAARMARLIDDLLSLSRLEMMEHQPPNTQIALVPVLQQVAAGFEARLAERHIRLETDFPPAPPSITGDADQLAQIAQNLLDNAIKYGRENGRIRLTVQAPPATQSSPAQSWPTGPGLVFSVSDDGIGIPRAHLPRITERFYRVDAGRSRAIGGTGLGLAIVKHIVNRHRGDIRIDSVEGEGTTISIWLPSGPVGGPVDGPVGGPVG